MTSPIKLMLLSLEFSPELSGGVGTHALELAMGLGRMGHQVTVLAYASGKSMAVDSPNVKLHLIPPSNTSLSKASKQSMVQGILSFNDDLAAYARSLIGRQRENFDIIQYYGWLTFSAARQLHDTFGIPLIGRVSYLSEPAERWWGQTPDPEIVRQEEELFGQTRTLISVSRYIKDLIRDCYPAPDHQIHVIHNGLDVRQFIREGLKDKEIQELRRAIAEPGQKVVLFAGRLHPMKGISSLLASAAKVLKRDPNVRYVLVGEPDSRDFKQTINRQFQQYPILEGKVKMLGRVPRHQLAILYRAADIFLMPSLYEPFGWVAIEAMAAGLPIISVNAGGPAEIVKHGETGLLVSIHANQTGPHEVDVEQLVEAQLALLGDAPLAKRLGNNGRERVLTTFNLEDMVGSTVDVYRRTISSFRRATV